MSRVAWKAESEAGLQHSNILRKETWVDLDRIKLCYMVLLKIPQSFSS